MKTRRLYSLCAICGALLVATALGDSWADEKMAQIQNMPENPSVKDIITLCGAAQVIPKNQQREEVRKLAVNRLLAIPDFTEQLQRHIELERGKWKSGGWEGNYNSIRLHLISLLRKIPDPRVVKMLGEMLKDMEWTRDPIEHIKSGADYSLTPPNGYLAARSLGALIEEPPLDKKPDHYLDQDVQPWIVWYEKVRAGEKTFSFKGESVEYRFKPDGTWETIPMANPRNSRPKPTSATKMDRPLRRSMPEQADTHALAHGISWWWYGIAGAALLAACAWFMRKKTAG